MEDAAVNTDLLAEMQRACADSRLQWHVADYGDMLHDAHHTHSCPANCAGANSRRADGHGSALVSRRASSLVGIALAATMCANVVSGYVHVATPVLSGFSAHRHPAMARYSRRHSTSTLSVGSLMRGKTESDAEGCARTAARLHAKGLAKPTAGEEAVDNIIQSTRQIGIVTSRLLEVRQDIDDNLELVGVWASWLSDNCPPCLTSTLADLTDARASQRKAAVQRLLTGLPPSSDGKQSLAAGNWAFAALAARLGDNSAAVREAAVKGLGHISEKGNCRNVVLAMASLIEEETAITVRTAALQALTRVAQRGDQEALAPVLNLLKRVEGKSRGDFFTTTLSSNINRQAVKALSTLADPGNEGAIKALLLRIMDDASPSVREAAIKGLGCIASPVSPTNPQVLWALGMSCADEDQGVRRTAAKTLRLLLKRREAKAVLCSACPASSPSSSSSSATPDVAAAAASENDADARVYWLLPGVWEA